MGAYVTALKVGKRQLTVREPPPRIIVWWVGDTFAGPVKVGGKQRSIATANRVCEVRIHGETEDHVEGMRSQFVLALHKAVKKAGTANDPNGGGSYVLGSGTVNQNTAISKNGFEYKLTFTVPSAITDRRWVPGEAPLPATYTGTQGDTYASQPEDTTFGVTVGVKHDAPDDDTEAVDIEVEKEV